MPIRLSQGPWATVRSSRGISGAKVQHQLYGITGELKNTEDKIGFARQFYNDVVMDYNNTVEMIPSSIIAGLFKFIPEEFIQIDEAEAVNPR